MFSSHRRCGRTALAALALVTAAIAGLVVPARPVAATPGTSFVLVADPQERKVFSYRVPGMQLADTLHDVGLGVAGTGANTGLGSATHSGTIALTGGRVIGTDDTRQEVIEIRVAATGRLSVPRRTSARLPTNGAWAAVDPLYRYFAVSSGSGVDESTGLVNIVDLATFRNHVVELPLDLDEEVHVYLGGVPVKLFASVGGRILAFPLSRLLEGDLTPSSESPLNPGSHGPFVSPATGKLGLTTTAGLDVVDLTCVRALPGVVVPRLACPHLELGRRTTIPWNVDGLSGSQNFRPRLMSDGQTVVGALGVAPPTATQWAETRQDVHVADLTSGTARRFTLGRGIAPRFASGAGLAAFVTVHPSGDRLHLLDTRRSSPTYLRLAGNAALAPMANGPVAGQPTAGRERRFVAMTPDGRYAFASHGGDGRFSVVDTRSMSVRTVAVPTALRGGGYLVGIDLAAMPSDLMAR